MDANGRSKSPIVEVISGIHITRVCTALPWLGQHERRLLLAGALQQVDHAAHFLGRQRLAPRQRQHRFLVARGQPRQLPRQRRTHQTQTQILFHRHAQLLQQRQPPAHPALVLAQQVRRLHLRQAVVTHQAPARSTLPPTPAPARWPRFSPRIAAFAVRSSTSSTRTLKLVNPAICRAAARRLKPSSNSNFSLRTHATTGDNCPQRRSEPAIASSACGSARR